MGSEMCIRDRIVARHDVQPKAVALLPVVGQGVLRAVPLVPHVALAAEGVEVHREVERAESAERDEVRLEGARFQQREEDVGLA